MLALFQKSKIVKHWFANKQLYNLIKNKRCMSREENVIYVFDRKAKLLHRERAAGAPDSNVYDYVKDEIGLFLI